MSQSVHQRGASIERWLGYRFADWSKMVAAGDTDYLVDALALHDHLYTLRDIFADPKIIKVANENQGCRLMHM